jgi:CubicO group peptidase (beta-lactamase class C family)
MKLSTKRTLAVLALGPAALALGGDRLPPDDVGSVRRQACVVSNDREAREIDAVLDAVKRKYALRAIVAGVSKGNGKTSARALGISGPGEPATPAMHWRMGAVTHTMMTTLLLEYVDRGVVSLDAPLSTWRPDLPKADKVTLRMLANMTAGYFDYVMDAGFVASYLANPYRVWQPEELIDIAMANPGNLPFEPGQGFLYAHTNYLHLTEVLEKIGGAPLDALLSRNVFDPLALHETDAPTTSAIAAPALRAYVTWNGAYTESTFWDPSWTSGTGISTVCDLVRWAKAEGTGALLTPASHAAQLTISAEKVPGYGYALGVIVANGWTLQTPSIPGVYSIIGYLPSKDLAIAVVATLGETSPAELQDKNVSRATFHELVKRYAPDQMPPDVFFDGF